MQVGLNASMGADPYGAGGANALYYSDGGQMTPEHQSTYERLQPLYADRPGEPDASRENLEYFTDVFADFDAHWDSLCQRLADPEFIQSLLQQLVDSGEITQEQMDNYMAEFMAVTGTQLP